MRNLIFVLFLAACGDNTTTVVYVVPDGGEVVSDMGVEADSTRVDAFVERRVNIKAVDYDNVVNNNNSLPTWRNHNGSLIAKADVSDGELKGDGTNYVVYNVKFPSVGVYYLSFRARYGTSADGELGGGGMNDSFFAPLNLGEMPPSVKIDGWVGDFEGNHLTEELSWYRIVKPYNVDKLEYQVAIGTREDGIVLDEIMFSQ